MTAVAIAPRVQETTSTTGTGTITLAGAATQCQSFAAGVGVGNITPYVLLSGNGADWEEGVGTVGGSGPYTLARTFVYRSTNSNAAISLTGTSIVFENDISDTMNAAIPISATISSSTSTLAGSTVYASSLSLPANATDYWRLSAVVKRPSSSSNSSLIIANSAGTSGYDFAYQNDGNMVLYSYYSSSSHVMQYAPGSSSNRNPAGLVRLEVEFSFGTNNLLWWKQLSPFTQLDGNVNFTTGGTFQVGISADAYSDIGKVTLEKLS